MERIGLDDYLAIAAAVLGLDAQTIVRVANIPPALNAPFASFGGQNFYPEPAQKAGILCSRLIRNHALHDGNKRSAYLSMLMFLDINAIAWTPPSEDERVLTIENLAARGVSEQDFITWVAAHIRDCHTEKRGK